MDRRTFSKKKFSFISFIFVTLFFFTALPSGGSAGTLLLEAAYRLALENHESIAASREALFQSERSIEKARAGLRPSVVADATYIKYSEEKMKGAFLIQPDSAQRFDLTVDQPLYTGGRATSYIRQSEKGAEAGSEAVAISEEEVVIETARAYFGALKAAGEVEIKGASLKRAAQQQRVSKARLKAGTAIKTLVLRADAEAASITAELIGARREARNWLDILARITGLQGVIIVTDPPEPAFAGKKGDVDSLIKTARERRRELRVKELDVAAASDGIGLAKGSFRPYVKLTGSYSYRDQSPETSFQLKEFLYGGININYPIFEGGLRKAELEEARSLHREALLDKLAAGRDIELEVRAAYNDVASLASVMESFEKLLSFARENYDMVFKQYKYGLADNMDLIDADSTLVEAEMGLMNARYDYHLSILELKKSMGILLDEIKLSQSS